MDNPIENQSPGQTRSYAAAVRSVDYVGGIIGLFFDDRKKLQAAIQVMNDEGYRLRSVLPAKNSVLSVLIQVLCLSLTLLLWAPVRGETLIFEG